MKNDNRPVPVIAGNYREYLGFISHENLKNHNDVWYVPNFNFLDGLPIGEPVIFVGTYAARKDWGLIKLSLRMIRPLSIYPEWPAEFDA